MAKKIKRGNHTQAPRSKSSFRRYAGNLEYRKKFLIFCEGKKTEGIYINELKDSLGKLNVDIKLIEVGKGIREVFLEARRTNSNTLKDYDFVWIIGDKDEVPNDVFNNTIAEAEKSGFRVAYSNAKFELWFLLHFDYINTAIQRNQYDNKIQQKIKTQLGITNYQYKKECHGLCALIIDRLQIGIQNSERLINSYPTHIPPANKDPSTTVHELVKQLQENAV